MTTDVYSALGLGPDAEDLYTDLLHGGARAPGVIGRSTGLDPDEVEAGLKELERSGLVTRDAIGRARACPPRAAVELWAAQRELETVQARQAAQALGQLYTAAQSDPSTFVEVIDDHETTVELVRALPGRAQHEVRALVRGPGLPAIAADPVPEQVEAAARGVRFRTVYDADVLVDESRLRSAERGAEAGEQGRSFAGVPLSMVVSDDDLAVIVLPCRGRSSVAVVVYPSSLLEAMVELFETFWRIGLPIAPDAGRRQPGPEGAGAVVDAEERRLVQLLATGLTDSVIARTLGISDRTLHRRLRRLQERLGVQSRFQLGLHAARQGWV